MCSERARAEVKQLVVLFIGDAAARIQRDLGAMFFVPILYTDADASHYLEQLEAGAAMCAAM